jgi:hypothetical protein
MTNKNGWFDAPNQSNSGCILGMFHFVNPRTVPFNGRCQLRRGMNGPFRYVAFNISDWILLASHASTSNLGFENPKREATYRFECLYGESGRRLDPLPRTVIGELPAHITSVAFSLITAIFLK